MPKRSQKNVGLNGEEGSNRKGSSGTIKSDSGITHMHTPKQPPELSEGMSGQRPSLKVKYISPPCQPATSHQIRFPKLEEYAHFHYDLVELPVLKLSIKEEDTKDYKHNTEVTENSGIFLVTVTGSAPKNWLIRRTLDNFAMLDKQLHKCIFDRKFSHLEDLQAAQLELRSREEVHSILESYLQHFSELAGGMVNCGSVLSWMEMDNRGHRLVATDDSGINTPAIAAAHVIKRYNGQAADEISLQVGDMISVIDMPPLEDTIWWRGKRGFEVGFFPSECVEVIGDKVPTSVTTRIPEPLAASAASRKPCENLGVGTQTKTVNSTVTTTTQKITPSTSSTPSPSPSRSSTVSAPASMGTSASTDWPPTMMKKHGKLLSFLRTFFSHRPARNQLKQSGIVKERVFGCDLGEHLLNSGHDVPLLLKSCTEIIEEYGIVHGIYRLSGITSNIQKLRLAFDEDRVPDLTEECYLQDIHSISSLIKMYFRELPNPLLTYQLYDKFADAVRDEDNKLLKIHDVVQQLPPPHYRTTEYLMRHLARVAAFGHETEMHSKNLAIVWAPNLLRSKELEAGGGAAALQGVGIQAVVTECLICYCDIIFSDKMPNYGSQEALRGHKKPRPKSLAISTPTRLLSLEEARERAFIGHLAPKKFIDVGGGPKNLPSKYHTVIDLPGYRKKVPSSTKENKGKKKTSSNVSSDTGGWKAIFTKPRSGSVKKTRKSSIQDSVTLGAAQAKALTEEDVHNWKRRLRSAKSAESLFSLTNTASSIGSLNSRTSNGQSGRVDTDSPSPSSGLDCLGSKGTRTFFHLSHKRSLSSDASAILQLRNMFHDNSGNSIDFNDMTGSSETSKQSFIRGDSTRKALHRRVPSAPNTPGQERRLKERRSSMSRDEASAGNAMDISLEDFIYPKSESRGDVNIDAAIKSRLLQVAEKTRSARSNEELTSSPLKRSAKTPPKGRKKAKGVGQASVGSSEDELSPHQPFARKVTRSSSDVSTVVDGSPYENEDQDNRMRRFYSRFHDYAEILSDEDGGLVSTPGSQGTMSVSSSGCNMQEVLDQIDCRLAMNAKLFTDRNSQSSCQPESRRSVEGGERLVSANVNKTDAAVSSQIETSMGKETEFPVNTVNRGGQRETEFPAMSSTSSTQHAELSGQFLDWNQPPSQLSNIDKGQNSLKESSTQRTSTEVRRRIVQSERVMEKSSNSSTLIARRHLEFIPSSSATAKEFENLNDLLDSLERGTCQPKVEYKAQKSPPSQPSLQLGQNQHQPQSTAPPQGSSIKPDISPSRQKMPGSDLKQAGEGVGRMSKCLSVPSDIARSLENVTESQSDMLSSITISELSMSVNSFGNGLGEDGVTGVSGMSSLLAGSKDLNGRQRRSTSLDSLTESDRLMTRTLREINQQMDAAFKNSSGAGVMMGSDSGNDSFYRHHRLVSSDLDLSSSPDGKVWQQTVRVSKPTWTNEKSRDEQGEAISNSLGSTNSLTGLHQSQTSLTPTQSCPYGILSSNLQQKPDGSLHQPAQICSLPPTKPSYHLDRVSPLSLDDKTDTSGPTLSTSGPRMSDITSTSVAHGFQSHFPSQPPSSLSAPQHQRQRYSFPSAMSGERESMNGRVQEETKVLHLGMNERRHSLCTLEGNMDQSWDGGKDSSSHLEHQVYLDTSQALRSDFYSNSFQKENPSAISSHPSTSSRSLMNPDSQQGRSDIASVCRNRCLSSSSSSVSSKDSEEFDEVASPDDEEGNEEERKEKKLTLRPGTNMNLPLPSGLDRGTEILRVSERPSSSSGRGDSSMFYQVVRRQHSPCVEQRSPIGDMALPGHQMAELDSCEPMSSLCAAGLMSQRVRLSRESSSSSLPSPDSSFYNVIPGNVTSPLATPGREALPDIVQSTTQPVGACSTDNRGRSNVPLQLALYHPDEFSMDIPASVSGPVHLPIPPSASLPEVHTSSDTIFERKQTLKKSSTDSSISDQMVFPQFSSLEPDAEISSGNIANSVLDERSASSGREMETVRNLDWNVENPNVNLGNTNDRQNLSLNCGVRMDELSYQDIKGRSSNTGGQDESMHLRNTFAPGARERTCVQPGKKMSQDREDQVAMEMDNICNKLLDDLSHCQTSGPDFGEMEGHASMEVESLPDLKERQADFPSTRKREISSVEGGQQLEPRDLYVEKFTGHLEEEQLQNVLNQDREFLKSPKLKEGSRVKTCVGKPPREVASQGSTPSSTDLSLPVRKSSFSKIPRPKQSSEIVSSRPVAGPSRRTEAMTSSMHMDTSPSSSSTSSTSSSSRSGHVRRSSETSGVSVSRRQGHSRRSSDTKLSDLCTGDSQTSPRPVSSVSPRCATSPRSRIGESKPENIVKSSRIPLSHRVPSPQQGENSNLGVVKPLSKIPSPVPKPRKKVGAEAAAPPVEDVMEVTRHSVRRETGRGGREQHELNARKSHSRNQDQSEAVAKLVIDSQPELKKKIQTVHAKKVTQPARQLAEAVDVQADRRTEETLTMVRFSNDIDTSHTCDEMESKKDIEKKVPPPVAKRKFHYDSRSLPRRSRFTDLQPDFCHQESVHGSQYCDMVGSRSSLDDSVLQLAAERHDLFVPGDCGEQRKYGYSTGSLRARRSQKMQSLMDLFERGSDSNVSDSSGSPGTRHRDRTYSGSMLGQGGQLTPCLEVGRGDSDDCFLPSDAYTHYDHSWASEEYDSSLAQGPSRQKVRTGTDKENMADAGLGKSTTTRQRGLQPSSRSSEPPQTKPRMTAPAKSRGPPHSPSANRQAVSVSSPPSSHARPPRHDKCRTVSESDTSQPVLKATSYSTKTPSLSASYTPQSGGGDLFFSPGQDPQSQTSNQPGHLQPSHSASKSEQYSESQTEQTNLSKMKEKETSRASLTGRRTNTPTSPKKERRNSIKELRQVFETGDLQLEEDKGDDDLGSERKGQEQSTSNVEPPVTVSQAPQSDSKSKRKNSDWTSSPASDSKPQTLRLCPKPFYGRQK